MKYIILVLSLLACGDTPQELNPSDIWLVVYEVYTEALTEPRPECEAWLANTQVLATGARIPGTNEILSAAAGPTALGRHTVANGRSYIWCERGYDADRINTCYGHEYLHALRYCQRGNADGDHVDATLWCDHGFLCEDFRGANTDSVEFQVNEILWAQAISQ